MAVKNDHRLNLGVVGFGLVLALAMAAIFIGRDTILQRRPYKLWARIDLRIGAANPPREASAARLQQAVQRLRGADR